MAIQAQMHDGTVLEFPDGTPDDVINKAAQSFIGEQPKQAGALSQAGDLTQVATKGGLSGFVGAIPDLWLQGLGALERMSEGEPDVVGARHPVSRAQMNLPPELRQGGIKPVPENAPAPPSITEALYKGMGGTENTPLEKAVKTGTQYLGSGMTFGGGLSKPNVLAGIGGGVGSYSDDPMMSPMLAMAFGLAPSVTTAAKQGLGKLSPSRSITKQIEGMGYNPALTAEDVGKTVGQDVSGQQRALGLTKEEIGKRIGETPAKLPEGYQQAISQELGGLNLDKKTLRSFNQEVSQMMNNNAQSIKTSSPAITTDDLAKIRAEYGDDLANNLAKRMGNADEGFLTFDDVARLKKYYREAADTTSRAAEKTVGQIRGVIKNAEMNQANAAGEAVNLAKFNKQYESISDFERAFVKGEQNQVSKIFGRMHTTFEKDPTFYAQEFSKLSPKVQQDVIGMHMKTLGGGNDFKMSTWGKNVKDLNPQSIMILAGNDPQKAEKLITIAKKADSLGKILDDIQRVGSTVAFVTGGRLVGHGVQNVSKILTRGDAVDVLSGMARISDKNFPNAMKSLTGRLTDIVREIENENATQPTNPQPSEPVAPPVTPERDVPNIPLYNQKQEAGQGDYLKTLAQVENAGRDTPDKNPNSSATGKYQIANDTWAGLQENYPEKFRGKDKNDPTVQEEATLVLQKESDDAITAAGLTPDDDTRSFVHFLGETDARKLLPKLNSKISAAKLAPRAAKSNPEYFYEKLPNGKRRERTPKEVFEYRKMKMSKAENEIQLARK